MTDNAAFPEGMFARDLASQSLGISVDVDGEGGAVARLQVTERMLNGFAVCHGGFLFTLADTAFAFACNSHGVVTVAAGASIEYLHPVQAGDRLQAIASERSRRGRTGIYDVSVRNQDDLEVAVFRGRSHATHKAFGD